LPIVLGTSGLLLSSCILLVRVTVAKSGLLITVEAALLAGIAASALRMAKGAHSEMKSV
jgi:hypothetical protein